MRRFLSGYFLCLLLLSGVSTRAEAFQRAYRSIGDYVRESPLVVRADISTQSATPFETILTIREVLKTDGVEPVAEGDKINLPLGITRYVVPREASDAVVILAPAWKRQPQEAGLLVSEVYQKPEQIAVVQSLIEVYRLPTERGQLEALAAQAARAGLGNPLFEEQLLADFRRMQNRANFDLALSSYAHLEPPAQAKLLEWLGTVGDARALPLLIGALDAPAPAVRAAAAHALGYYFPGAPGVTPAFERLLSDPSRRPLALAYFAPRAPQLVAPYLKELSPTPWQRAQQLAKDGQTDAARAAFFALIDRDNDPQYGFTTINAAQQLLPLLQTQADQTRLRRLVLARLSSPRLSDYTASQFIALLRALPAPENVTALLRFLVPRADLPVFAAHEPARAATFALLELGADARQRATQSIVAQVKARFAPGTRGADDEATLYACELAWLADDATWQSLAPQLSPGAARALAALQPLRAAATAPDEARALSELLPDTDDRWQNKSDGWIIARLTELRDPVALAPILAEIKRAPYSGRDEDFKKALTAIGGPGAEAAALQLLSFPDPSQRVIGMDVLHALRGEKLRPRLLQFLATASQDDLPHAIYLLGVLGTPQDLALLASYADFWNSTAVGRGQYSSVQSYAASAMAQIRDRHHLNWSAPGNAS